MLYINVPICAVVIIAAYLLVSGEAPRRSGLASFDTPGALLATGGMLLLIYALVKAPDNGWGSAQTIGELAAAAVLLAALIINEMRHPNPVLPLSIFRIKGLAATDASMVLSLAGLNSAFFFISLYMQEVLHFSNGMLDLRCDLPPPRRRAEVGGDAVEADHREPVGVDEVDVRRGAEETLPVEAGSRVEDPHEPRDERR